MQVITNSLNSFKIFGGWTLYVSIVLIILCVVLRKRLNRIETEHRSNPEWVKQQEERESEYRRHAEEDKELDDMVNYTYTDEESEIHSYEE